MTLLELNHTIKHIILKNNLMKWNRRLLDYDGGSAANMLEPFFPAADSRPTAAGTYDVVFLNRDDVQGNFDEVLQYLHADSKIIVNIVPESGCFNEFLNYFDELTKKHFNIQFYLIADVDFDYNFSNNVKVCSSYNLSLLMFFENYSYQRPNNQAYTIDGYRVYQKTNGFCCLNGRLRTHRVFLLLEMLKRNLLKLNRENDNTNMISFLFYTNEGVTDYEEYSIMVDNINISGVDKNILLDAKKYLPIKLWDEDGSPPKLLLGGDNVSRVLNFVTENISGMDCSTGIITFTEKAWAPFKLHQIPIYSSVPGYVSTIRNMGFDLFDDVVNHSYDSELDNVKRLQLAVDQLEKVSKLNLVEFYRKNYSRFIKNNLLSEELKMKGFFTLKNFILEQDLI